MDDELICFPRTEIKLGREETILQYSQYEPINYRPFSFPVSFLVFIFFNSTYLVLKEAIYKVSEISYLIFHLKLLSEILIISVKLSRSVKVFDYRTLKSTLTLTYKVVLRSNHLFIFFSGKLNVLGIFVSSCEVKVIERSFQIYLQNDFLNDSKQRFCRTFQVLNVSIF